MRYAGDHQGRHAAQDGIRHRNSKSASRYFVGLIGENVQVFFGQTSSITAAQACHAMDAVLLTLNNIEEEYFVLNMEVGGEPLRKRCEYLLLSPWSEGSGRQLTGPKGAQTLYSNFVGDEQQKDERCAWIETRRYKPPHHPPTNFSGTWISEGCDVARSRSAYICEKEESIKDEL
ncbi:unnamed protein product, partial [Mesorhabditis spiculigera]